MREYGKIVAADILAAVFIVAGAVTGSWCIFWVIDHLHAFIVQEMCR